MMEDHIGAGPAGPGDARPERPLTVPRPGTGEAGVDAALARLDDLTQRPVTEHPGVFEQVHAELSEILGELGSAGRDGD
jgi:hypothetical protein